MEFLTFEDRNGLNILPSYIEYFSSYNDVDKPKYIGYLYWWSDFRVYISICGAALEQTNGNIASCGLDYGFHCYPGCISEYNYVCYSSSGAWIRQVLHDDRLPNLPSRIVSSQA
jgi:hypothetical protein